MKTNKKKDLDKLSIADIFFTIIIVAFFILAFYLMFAEADPLFITFLIITPVLFIFWGLEKKMGPSLGMKDKSKKWIDIPEKWIVIVIVLFILALLILDLVLENNADLLVLILLFIFLNVISFFGALKFIADQRILSNRELMKSFSENKGFTFKPRLKEKKINSKILDSGRDRQILNYMKGEYKNYPVEIYNYRHFFSSTKSGHYYEYLVFELKLKNNLPDVIVTPKNNYLSLDLKRGIDFIIADKLETESNDFNRLFEVYFKKGRKGEDGPKILEILTPDVISMMIDEEGSAKNKGIHLELKDNTIFLYKSIKRSFFNPKIIKNTEDIQKLLDLSFEILEEAER